MGDLLGRGKDCNRGCGGIDSSLLFFFLILVMISNGNGFGGCGCR